MTKKTQFSIRGVLLVVSLVAIWLAAWSQRPISDAERQELQIHVVNNAICANYPPKTNFQTVRPKFDFFEGQSIAKFPEIVRVWEAVDTSNAKQRLAEVGNNDLAVFTVYLDDWLFYSLKYFIKNPDNKLYHVLTRRGELTGDHAVEDHLIFCIVDGMIVRTLQIAATEY